MNIKDANKTIEKLSLAHNQIDSFDFTLFPSLLYLNLNHNQLGKECLLGSPSLIEFHFAHQKQFGKTMY